MTDPYYRGDGVTLYLGDCLELTEWLAADVLVTDPPYGMAFVSGQRRSEERVRIHGDHTTDARDGALRAWGERPALVFGNWKIPRPAATRHLLVWHKTAAGPGMGDLSIPWGSATEEIYVLGDGFTGPRTSNVIATSEARGNPYGEAAKTGHPTPKPVGLMEQLIAKCPPGVVADPFAGSGATLLAARNLGRSAIGVELEERYCEIVANRLAQAVLL